MRIPQYEQRIIADPAKRTQVNLKEPETFRDLSSLQRQTKSIEKTANLGADLYLDMKKQRDQGIVDEFTNQYNVEKINKVNELRNQYKGANSTKIVDEFSKWHNDYLATHLGIGPSGGKDTLILENDEQIEGARKALADDLPTSINSLSSYAATELNNYRNHQFEGVAFGIQERISKEDDVNNTGILINNLKNSVAQHYSGESSEYIHMQSQKLVNSALATNVRNSLASNPERAMLKLQSELWVNNLTGEDINALEKEAVDAFVEKQSLEVAKAGLANKNIDFALDMDTFEAISPVLDKQGGRAAILAKIKYNAENKKLSLAQAQRASESYKYNKAITSVVGVTEIISSDGYTNEQKANAQAMLVGQMRELQQTSEGHELSRLLSDASDETVSYMYMKNRLSDYTPWSKSYSPAYNEDMRLTRIRFEQINRQRENDISAIANIKKRIDEGNYEDFRSFRDELSMMHGTSKAEIFEYMASASKYKEAEMLTRKHNFNIDVAASKGFESVEKRTSGESPLYGSFKKQFKNELLMYFRENNKMPEDKDLYGISMRAKAAMYGQDKIATAVALTAANVPVMRADLKRIGTVLDYKGEVEKLAENHMSDKAYDSLSDDQKKVVAELILSGKLYQANEYVNWSVSNGD